MKKGNCLWCQKEIDFTQKRVGSKYCNDKCGADFKNNERKNNKVKKQRNCLWCGDDIIEQYAATRYCTNKEPDCANQANYSKLWYEGKCQNCGEDFKSKRKG